MMMKSEYLKCPMCGATEDIKTTERSGLPSGECPCECPACGHKSDALAFTMVRYSCGPKSICKCGHTGDGPDSEHWDNPDSGAAGHGACDKCTCQRFTWAGFLPGYLATYIKGGTDA